MSKNNKKRKSKKILKKIRKIAITFTAIFGFTIFEFILFVLYNLGYNYTSFTEKVCTNLNDSKEPKIFLIVTQLDRTELKSDKKEAIEYYIRKSSEIVIPLEEWTYMTDDELYYIRNGIYAYEGYYFPSEYYNDFSWYRGNISPDNFTKDMLSDVQMTNVLNIRAIEEERSPRK